MSGADGLGAAQGPEDRPVAMVSLVSAVGFRGEVRAGRHRLVVDEAVAVGGEDEGPGPYQLVLAGLVQCTAATLRMYADRKGWELGEITVRARLLRAGEGAGSVERIDRTVALSGRLDDEQRARLAAIAERTPVTRTLSTAMAIATTVTSAGPG